MAQAASRGNTRRSTGVPESLIASRAAAVEAFNKRDLERLVAYKGGLGSFFLRALKARDLPMVMGMLERAEDRLPGAVGMLASMNMASALRDYPRPLGPEELELAWDTAVDADNWDVVAELLRQGFVGQDMESLSWIGPETARQLLEVGPPKDRFVAELYRVAQEAGNPWMAQLALLNHGLIEGSIYSPFAAMELRQGADIAEFQVDHIPLASSAAILAVPRSRLPSQFQARYARKLLERGNNLDAYFASRDPNHHPEVLEAVYQPEYATAALLNALVTGNQEVVRWLEGKGVRVARPELFGP